MWTNVTLWAPPLRLDEEARIKMWYCRESHFKLALFSRPAHVRCRMQILAGAATMSLSSLRQGVGTGDSQAQETLVLPSTGSAKCLKTPGLTSRSTALHPTPIFQGQQLANSEHGTEVCISHLSTTVRSTLLPSRRALILCLHSGLAFGFEPLDAASKTVWLMDTMLSLSEEVMPQAPRPGE